MGELVMIVGGVSVVFGTLDVWSLGDSKGKTNWQKPVIKIFGGLAVVVVGALMKHFGV